MSYRRACVRLQRACDTRQPARACPPRRCGGPDGAREYRRNPRVVLHSVSGSTRPSLSRAGAYTKLGARCARVSVRRLRSEAIPALEPLFAPLPPYGAARIAAPERRARSRLPRTDGNARARGRASPLPPRSAPDRRGRERIVDWCFGQRCPTSYSACWSFAAWALSSFAGCSSFGAARVDSSAACRLTALILPRSSC